MAAAVGRPGSGGLGHLDSRVIGPGPKHGWANIPPALWAQFGRKCWRQLGPTRKLAKPVCGKHNSQQKKFVENTGLVRVVWESSAPPKSAPLHEKGIQTGQPTPLQERLAPLQVFFGAPQEVLHQIVELGRIAHHTTGYVALVPLRRKKKEKSNFRSFGSREPCGRRSTSPVEARRRSP